MLVDLKVKSADDLQDGDILMYNAAEKAMVPMRQADFLKLFGFNLVEVQTAISNTNTRIKNAETLAENVASKAKTALTRVAQRQVNFVKIFKGGIKK
jgi:hypothetical protein